MAMGFILLAISWPSFAITEQLLPLFQGRVSAWKDIPPETLMQWSDECQSLPLTIKRQEF
jgi:hypothetical protein